MEPTRDEAAQRFADERRQAIAENGIDSHLQQLTDAVEIKATPAASEQTNAPIDRLANLREARATREVPEQGQKDLTRDDLDLER